LTLGLTGCRVSIAPASLSLFVVFMGFLDDALLLMSA
jgi:hypothetical protein